MSQDRLQESLDIDRRSAIDIVDIIQQQDALVAAAVAAERQRIAHAIEQIAERAPARAAASPCSTRRNCRRLTGSTRRS
jgi:N-acetylmuramic acid 6-phosphate (MurNAc-6-P) etherase